MRSIVRCITVAIFALLLGSGLTACGNGPAPAPKPVPPVPANVLTVTLDNDGKMVLNGPPVFVTDKSAEELRVIVRNHGGNSFKSSPMDDKIVNVTNLERTDLTQPMRLGSLTIDMVGVASDNQYGGYVDVLLPQGTYELQLDGVPSGVKFKIAAMATPKPASATVK